MSRAVLRQTLTLHPCCAVMIFHVANAWQEGKDIVKLYACCFEEVGQLRLCLLRCFCSVLPGS